MIVNNNFKSFVGFFSSLLFRRAERTIGLFDSFVGNHFQKRTMQVCLRSITHHRHHYQSFTKQQSLFLGGQQEAKVHFHAAGKRPLNSSIRVIGIGEQKRSGVAVGSQNGDGLHVGMQEQVHGLDCCAVLLFATCLTAKSCHRRESIACVRYGGSCDDCLAWW